MHMFYLFETKIWVLRAFLFLFMLCFSFTLSSASTAQYQKRLLGDKAFDSGLYDVAMNYYQNYLKDAGGDSPAIRDAYFSLISTCLRANNIEEARRLYGELSTKFEQFFSNHPEDQRTLNYWKAEILLYEGKFKEANRLYDDVLNDSTSLSDQISLNAMAGKAICFLRMGDLNRAYTIFDKVRQIAKDKKDKYIARSAAQEMIIIDLATNKYDAAKIIINEETDTANTVDSVKIDLLNIYILTMEDNLKDARALYNKIKSQSLGPDYLWFFVTYTLSASYIKAEKYDDALNIIDDAFALAPDMYDKEQITIFKINSYIKLNNYEQAILTAKMFLDTFPKSGVNAKILLTLSEILANEKRNSDISALSEKYFSFNLPAETDTLELASLFGQNALQLSNYSLANQYFDYIISKSKAPSQIGNAKYCKAESILAQKNYSSALNAFITVQDLYPEFKEKCLLRESQIYITQDDYKSSEKALKMLVDEFPDSKLEPSPFFTYAVVLKKLKDYDTAISQFAKYAQDNPKSDLAPNALYEAGSLSLLLQKNDMSSTYLQQIINNYSKSSLIKDALYKLVFVNIASKNIDNAAKFSKMLLNSFPESEYAVQVRFWLSNYFEQNRQFADALKILDSIIKDSSNKPLVIVNCYYREAFILFQTEESSKALELINTIESKYPQSEILPLALYFKGDILSSDGKYSEAIQAYQSAYDKSNNAETSIASLGRIGDCYFAELNYSQDKNNLINSAILSYKKVLESNRISVLVKTQTLYKIGKCYEVLNDKEKAIEFYHEAFYSNILEMESGRNPSKIWFVKSAIALTRLLQDENTPNGAIAAIDVLRELVKYNISPVSDFEQRIDEIKNLYKLKE